MTAKELQETLLLIGQNISPPPFSYIGLRETYCDICGHEFNKANNYERHLTTAKHEKMAARRIAARDIARECGMYDAFRQAWIDYEKLPVGSSFDERYQKHKEAKAIIRSIVENWRLKNATVEAKKIRRRRSL
jgi:hypothetical protein